MAEFRINHQTRYDYSESVSRCYNIAVIRPAHRHGQLCISSELEIHPRPAVLNMRRDFHGNERYYFTITEEHRSLIVRSKSLVRSADAVRPDVDASLDEYTHLIKDPELCEFLLPSPLVPVRPAFARLTTPFFQGKGVIEGSLELCQYIRHNFKYDPDISSIQTSVPETLKKRAGVCQDFTHLAIAGLRSIGIPTRYVSGYIETHPVPGQEKLLGSDATHAWYSVYLPDRGWFDFDPTNGKARTDEYIETAIGRDFTDISPMRGVVFGGGKPTLDVSVDVLRL